MPITLNLGSALEKRLQAAAARQGKKVEAIALELLSKALPPISDQSAALHVRQKVQAIGQFRPFAEFKADQAKKYNLP